MTSSIRRGIRRPAVVALTAATAIAVALIATVAVAQSRSSGGSIVVKTSVTAIAANGRATVTAVVRFGIQGASGGAVTFTNKTTHRTLGSAELKTKSGAPCAPPAHVCHASLSVPGSKLRLGYNRITATFTPDKLYAPSLAGKGWIYRGLRPNCRPRSTNLPVFTASTRQVLCRGSVSFGTGTSATVTSRNRVVVSRETVIAFGSQTLPCTTSHTGDLVAFSISGRSAPGSLAVQVVGRPATIAHARHPHGYSCYESTIPFRTASGARAKRLADGNYYGTLPHCRDNDGDDVYPRSANSDDGRLHPAPCIEWQQFSHRHGHAVWTEWLQPITGDPRHSF